VRLARTATNEPLLKADAPDRHIHVCAYVEDGRVEAARTGQMLIFVNPDWRWELCIVDVIRIEQIRYCPACGHELGEVIR
jgi:hypothetical protein